MVGGIVFGEIFVWWCYFDFVLVFFGNIGGKVEMFYIFIGYEGSIFGVNILVFFGLSGRCIIVSCSDDWMIWLWDIIESNVILISLESDVKVVCEIGFIIMLLIILKFLVMVMGYLLCIWGVCIVVIDEGDFIVVYFFGEDVIM